MSYPPSQLSNLTERELLLLCAERLDQMHHTVGTALTDIEGLKKDRWITRGVVAVVATLSGAFGSSVSGWMGGKH